MNWSAASGRDAVTSGIEGAWTTQPHLLGQRLLRDAALRLGTDEEPGRRLQGAGQHRRRRHAGDVEDPSIRRMPMMTDADMALKMDPAYTQISERFAATTRRLLRRTRSPAPGSLTHRDMGPKARYIGPTCRPKT